jgi:hypothetical protein
MIRITTIVPREIGRYITAASAGLALRCMELVWLNVAEGE